MPATTMMRQKCVFPMILAYLAGATSSRLCALVACGLGTPFKNSLTSQQRSITKFAERRYFRYCVYYFLCGVACVAAVCTVSFYNELVKSSMVSLASPRPSSSGLRKKRTLQSFFPLILKNAVSVQAKKKRQLPWS